MRLLGDKISVIVPIYRVEDYLHRCIDSIINQTYTNLEIILVDDGSPDNCPMICDEYAEKDSRIRVVHKKNGGLSDARNAGLGIATGEYIAFVDSDDWVHKDMYKVLHDTMKKNNADIVECGILSTYEYIDDKKIDNIRIQSYSKSDSIGALITQEIRQTVWNKLYKREVINNILFDIGKLHEDEFWTYKILDRSNNLIRIDNKMYYYFQRENSIMSNSYSIKRLDALEARYKRYLFIKDKYPKYTDKARLDLFYICLFYLQKSLIYLGKEQYKIAQEIIKGYLENIEIKNIKNLSYKDKLWVLLSKISLIICARVRNSLNIGVK